MSESAVVRESSSVIHLVLANQAVLSLPDTVMASFCSLHALNLHYIALCRIALMPLVQWIVSDGHKWYVACCCSSFRDPGCAVVCTSHFGKKFTAQSASETGSAAFSRTRAWCSFRGRVQNSSHKRRTLKISHNSSSTLLKRLFGTRCGLSSWTAGVKSGPLF